MKASQDGTSVARRQVEASRIVANVATLPAGTQFLYCGDMNMSSSSQTPYQTMAGPTAPFVDPISSPGAWNSNPSAFRYILTQDPGPAQNMDSRFDFVLLGKSLYDGVGMDYVGSRTLPYSTSTWNDPNHSYRCWGNDGSTFSAPMNVATNSMVGPTIAQALRNCATSSGGHLPVFLDLKMPAKILIPTMTVDFGVLYRNAVAQRSITIQHAGDTAKWNVAGLQNLTYSMSAGSLITVSTGTKSLTPGAVTRQPIRVNTSNIGRFQQFVTVASNDTSNPTIQVLVKWSVRNDWEGPIGGGRDPRP